MAMGTRACCLCTLHVHAPTPGTPPACVLPACAAMHACMLKLPRRQGVRVRLPSMLAEPEVRHAHASSPRLALAPAQIWSVHLGSDATCRRLVRRPGAREAGD